MIASSYFEANMRIRRLIEKFSDVDVLLVTNQENKRYLSHFTGSGGYLLVSKQKTYLFVTEKYIEQATSQCTDVEIVNIERLGFFVELKQVVKQACISHIGFEYESIKHSLYCGLQASLTQLLVPCLGYVERLRAVKSKAEIDLIATSCHIAEQAIERGIALFNLNMTERELANQIEYEAKQLGAEAIDFLIVVSGVRGAQPHGRPSSKRIEYGELIIIDFGVIYRGYHSDITRTFAAGEVSKQLRHMHCVVNQAQALGMQFVKQGVSTRDIDGAVRAYIEQAGYGKWFSHGLGHGIGLQGHEAPLLNQQSDCLLQDGMVITIEPGIYIPGIGGVRIEDTLLVKCDTAVSITRLSRYLRNIVSDE